jgi:2-polyprenyl-6-methoxyphenol hydroxylase-like FAD-dependent oxidoreductase
MTYYFIFEKLEKKLSLEELPRYSKADAEAFAERHMERKIRPDLQFGDIWKKSKVYGVVPIEEAKFKLWTWGRIACFGDSIHKMTPNTGTGGNACIESAAAIANAVHLLANAEEYPTESQIKEALQGYQNRRKPRTDHITHEAGLVTRLEALDKPIHRFIVRYIVPYSGDLVADTLSPYTIDSELLVRLIRSHLCL